VPGQIEAELYGVLRERRNDLDRALGGLEPLLDNPVVARTPLGDALRRLIDVLGSLDPRGGASDGRVQGRHEQHRG
jgi:hypothetical protein